MKLGDIEKVRELGAELRTLNREINALNNDKIDTVTFHLLQNGNLVERQSGSVKLLKTVEIKIYEDRIDKIQNELITLGVET